MVEHQNTFHNTGGGVTITNGDLADFRRFSVSSLSGIDDAAKIDRIVRSLKSILTQVVGGETSGVNTSEFDAGSGFREIGMDSLMLLQFHNHVQEVFQAELNPTALFDYPTIDDLASYLLFNVLEWGSGVPSPGRRHSMIMTPALDENAVAIVGMSCEIGGAHNPAEYWQLLLDGVEALQEIPPGRMDYERYYEPLVPGADTETTMMYTNRGGFIPCDRVRGFDCRFFELSPVEARIMDPQHRLMMRLAWEALEDACIPADSLRGTKTGVYVGVSTNDYSDLLRLGRTTTGTFCTTSNLLSMASGRISYMLGLSGPSISVDTACSSSLVAVHLACQALRLGECGMALVGGVQLLLSPKKYVDYCKAKLLARDGRCRAFDDAATGFVRGEGGGVVVLKRLSEALDAGDNVLAVIKGSAVNQDGKGMGLTVPNGFAQAAAIRRALRNASMAPEEIGMIEAHGTGTALGDPIEMNALESIFGDATRAAGGRQLYIGAGKCNVGHLEAAAGVAGLIKVVQCLRYGTVPPHPNLKKINHLIANANFFNIPRVRTSWQTEPGVLRAAGISGFGVSGTNAHLIVQEAPPTHSKNCDSGGWSGNCGPSVPGLVTISAKSPEALEKLLPLYVRHLQGTNEGGMSEEAFRAIAYTSNIGRAHFEHRVAVVGSSAAECIRILNPGSCSDTELLRCPDVLRRVEEAGDDALLALVFTDSAVQFRMGYELYAATGEIGRVYAQNMDTCSQIIGELLHGSGAGKSATLTEALYEKCNLLTDPVYAELALFATQYSMAQLLIALGVQPRYVAAVRSARSVCVAAAVAGIMTLADALHLLYTIRYVAGQKAKVAKGARIVSEAEWQHLCKSIVYSTPTIPLVAFGPGQDGGAGLVKGPGCLQGSYWASSLLQVEGQMPSQVDIIDALRDLNCVVFVDAGAAPAKNLKTNHESIEWIPCFSPGMPATDALAYTLGRLYCCGIPVNFHTLHEGTGQRARVPLPNYPFDHSQRCWPPRFAVPEEYFAASLHPLLGRLMCETPTTTVYENHVSLADGGLEWLGAHMFKGEPICPASAYVELGAAIGRHLAREMGPIGLATVDLRDLEFEVPLMFPQPGDRVKIQSSIKPQTEVTTFACEVTSQHKKSGWSCHFRAILRITDGGPTSTRVDFGALIKRARLSYVPTADFYDRYTRSSGIRFGREFQNLVNIWSGPSDVVSEVDAGSLDFGGGAGGLGGPGYLLHPALLDSCFQTLFSLPCASETYKLDYMVVSIGSVTVALADCARTAPTKVWVHARLLPTPPGVRDTIIVDMDICTPDGVVIAQVGHFRVARVESQVLNNTYNKTTTTAMSDVAPREKDGLPEQKNIFYQEEWEPAPLVSVPVRPATSGGAQLFLVATSNKSEMLATALQQKFGSAKVHVIHASDTHQGADSLQAFLSEELKPFTKIHAFIFLATAEVVPVGTESMALVDIVRRTTHGLLLCAQHLVKFDIVVENRCMVVTTGVSPVDGNRTEPFLAPLWGMVKSLRREHPELKMVAMDLGPLDRTGMHASVDQILAELGSNDYEYQICYNKVGTRYAPRFKQHNAPTAAACPQFRNDRTYLVTGGVGGLGLELCRWINANGGRHVTVLSRSVNISVTTGLSPDIQVVQCDVGDEEQLRAVLKTISPPIAGCFHVAGVYADAGLLNQSWDTLLASFRSKVVGTWNLHQLLPADLELFVMYSSYASLRGSRGQINYAAANAFLDAMAHYRIARGQKAMSVNWGAWAGVGQATKHKMPPGLRYFQPETGLNCLGAIISGDRTPQVCISKFDWDEYFASETFYDPWLKYMPGFNMTHPAPTVASFSDQTRESVQLGVTAPTESTTGVGQYSLAQMKTVVREAVAHITGFTNPSDRKVFSQLGLDSIMTIDLRNRIQEVLKFNIPMPTLFDNQTIDALAKALHKSAPAAPVAAAAVPAPLDARSVDALEPANTLPRPGAIVVNGDQATSDFRPKSVRGLEEPLNSTSRHPSFGVTPSSDQEDVAIVGMSFRFGALQTAEEYWRILASSGDNMVPIPHLRFDIDRWYDPNPDHLGRIYTRVGGFCPDVDCFDNDFFEIGRQEAELLDPQQRFLLEGTWEALEHAGIPPHSLNGSKTAVYIGVNTFEYNELLEEERLTQHADSKIPILCFTGNTASSGAGRISYLLGLQGPSVAVDSACSSACVALQIGARDLLSGDMNLAIVGGIGLNFSPNKYIHHCVARIIATDDRCKVFDSSSDGFTRGEGFGIMVLKRMCDAVRDKDNVLAVVKSGIVSQGGFASGWIVPNGPGQVTLMREALAKAKVDPTLIDYVELHGTGTQMGDAIELNAVEEVYREHRKGMSPLRVGSAKGNVGHLEAACAMAGLVKLILAMRNKTIPPQPHFKIMNKNVNSPNFFGVPTACEKWEPRPGHQELLAGISALGFSGTNAHLIVQSYYELERRQAEESQKEPKGPFLCTVSAKSQDALKRLVTKYCQDAGTESSLFKFCYTSNVGRSHYFVRFAAVVHGNGHNPVKSAMAQFRGGFEEDGDRAVVFIFGDGNIAVPLDDRWHQLRQHPSFAQALAECDTVLGTAELLPAGVTLNHVLSENHEHEPQGWVRPFVLQYALSKLWMKLIDRLTPEVVIGDGVGEYVGAVITSVMSLEAAMRVLSLRAASLSEIKADPDRALKAVARFKSSLALMQFEAPTPGVQFISAQLGRVMLAFNAQYWADQLIPTTPRSFSITHLKQPDESVLLHLGVVKQSSSSTAEYTQIHSIGEAGQVNWETFIAGVAQAYNAGLHLNMDELYAKRYFKSEKLPTYSFEKTRLWYK